MGKPRNRSAFAGAGLTLCMAVVPAQADQAVDPAFTGSIERHFTTNALDSDRAVPDWYTLLRGSFTRKWGDEDANILLSAEAQATRHDVVRFEDDRAAAVSAQAFRRFGKGIEIRGTLSYRATSDGDTLAIGPVLLATRTLKQVIGSQLQLGLELGKATALIVDMGAGLEWAGPTRFQDDILPATRLDPDKRNLQLGARVVHSVGAFTLGASANALQLAVERLGSPPVGVSLRQYGLRGELGYKAADGATLGLALGAELLRGADGTYSRVRPAWQLSFFKPLWNRYELRGTWFGRYETGDSDDPLASWVQRAELEIGVRLRKNLKLAAGAACEVKQNLLWENEERRRIFYAEATYDFTPKTSAVFRVDMRNVFKTVIDTREKTVDAFVGLRAKI